MATLLIKIILCLFIPSLAVAGSVTVTVGQPTSSVADNWSCTDATILCESFDATGYDTTSPAWSETVPANTIVNEDLANTTALGCDSVNVQSLRLQKNNAADPPYTVITFASTNTEHYGLVRVKIVTENASDSDTGEVLSSLCQFTRVAFRLRLRQTSGTLYLDVGHTNQADSLVWDNGPAISLDTWYLVAWHWIQNQASAGITASIDGSPVSISDTSTVDYNSTGFRFYLDWYQETEANYDTLKIHTSAPSCN
jgi:hypothetical protein